MLKKNCYFYLLAWSILPFTASAEVFEEEYTTVEATEIHLRSDEEKIQDPTYQPDQDEDKLPLNTLRRFVMNGDTEVRYYALNGGNNPTLLYLNPPDSQVFTLAKAYQQHQQEIQITPQLSHQISNQDLFSLMPLGKNLALFFQTQYYYTPEERQQHYAASPLFESYDTRSSYELIEVNPNGDILHRAKLLAPPIEDGMSIGSNYAEDEDDDQSNKTLTYQTKTPGNYDSAKPYDLQITAVYQNGKFTQSEEKQYLTLKEYDDLKRTKIRKDFTNESIVLYGHDEDLQSTTCLDDYFTYQDRAAPKNATWGNEWLQQSPQYNKFLSDYQKGKSYTWQNFKKNFCPSTAS